jgi:hypothetical protein
MKQTLLILLFLISSFVVLSNNSYSDNYKGPVVVELFTSQSCSSCPPADKILKELSKQHNIIALGCHVTYWNHLQWKDTLSNEFCTDRQRAYKKISNRPSIFTPEMLINGEHSLIGSRRSAAFSKVKQRQNDIEEIKVDVLDDEDILLISLPSLTNPIKSSLTLNLIAFGSPYTQHVPSGENKNKTLSYTNPVSSITIIDKPWDGTKRSIKLPIKDLDKKAAGYAVLAQEGNTGVGLIVAAGKIKMRK